MFSGSPVFPLNDSQRWTGFLQSAANGLRLIIVLVYRSRVVLQISSQCHHTCQPADVFPDDFVSAASQLVSPGMLVEFVTREGQTAAVSVIADDYLVFFFACSECRSEYTPLLQRARVARDLIVGFHAALTGFIARGEKEIELSALRQINRLTLGLFRGDYGALSKAFDLIISALIIILDARASWLVYDDKDGRHHCIKGDQDAAWQHLNGRKASATCLEIPISGGLNGTIGVLDPASPEHAEQLLQMMGQECVIVYEIDHLFRLFQGQLTRVLGVLKSGILLIDAHMKFQYINAEAARLLGEDPLQLLGVKLDSRDDPWNEPLKARTGRAEEGFRECLGTGEKRCVVDWQLLPLYDGTQLVGWLVHFFDRTEHYRWLEAGRQAENLASISAVMGPLAHEIRNPLAVIKSMMQLALYRNDSDKTRGYMDLVLREVDRINSLVNNFLQLGRTAGKLEPVNLAALVADLLPLLQNIPTDQELRIDTDLQPVSPILADQKKINQVVLNLVRNAVEATESKTIDIRISLVGDGKWVCLSIADRGHGLTDEAQARLFQPFFTTKERGTGLGLSVSKAIISQHGGELTAAANPEGGAVFSIRLPVLQSMENLVDKVDVLLLLRDDMIRLTCQQVLSMAGFITAVATPDSQMNRCCRPAVILADSTEWLSEWDTDPGVITLMVGEPPGNGDGFVWLPKPLDYPRLIHEINRRVFAEGVSPDAEDSDYR